MRKITDFIVEKRNYILVIFIILSGICLFLSSKVKINYDLTRYLPDDSSTKIGVDIMNEEFATDKSSTLEVMFKDLKDDEKDDVKKYLASIKNVDEVLYDDTEDYNKDEYTLYKVNVDGGADSKNAAKVYSTIMDKYDDYEIYTSGDVSTYNAPVLKIWVVALAICSAMVILIIMCDSYVEPFLFLFVIGLAVFLNKGTNIIFPNVSNITNSICAILQMALSMDYSIMLMNRYRQEKEHEPDNKKAMKEALYHSFLSISSSSVTTIVGLLALVFMSFTIGIDLGLVLAKGVIFSLISIFFVLPSLILLFDKLIMKTTKKRPKISLSALGKFSFFIRRAAIVIFIVIFAGSFLLKSNLEYEFTGEENDKVKEIFNKENQIALIYNNDEEEYFGDYCQKLSDDKRFSSVLCYANTLSEGLKYNELNDKFASLGVDVTLDEDLIKTIYYNYYSQNEDNKMSYSQFTSFILNEVANDPNYGKALDNNIKASINKLSYFTNQGLIYNKWGYNDMANILGIPNANVQSLYLLYNSMTTKTALTLPQGYNFIVNNVLNNEAYSSMLTKENIASLQMMAPFIDKDRNNTKLESNAMAALFGMDASLVQNIYKYYNAISEPNETLSFYDFANFTLTYVYPNPEYAQSFDENTVKELTMIKTFADSNLTAKKMDAGTLGQTLNISPSMVNVVIGLYNKVNNSAETKMSIDTFVSFLLSYKDNPLMGNYLDDNTISTLELANMIIESSKEKKVYNYKNMSDLLGYDVKNIYTLYHLNNNFVNTLTPREFISFIINTKEINASLDEASLAKLNLVNMIMDAVQNDKKYSYKELSALTNVSEDNLKLMYSLYDMTYNANSIKYNLYEFVNFILNSVAPNPNYSSMFNASSISKLKAINNVMIASINNTKFTSTSLVNNLAPLAGGIDTSKVSLVYLLYGARHEYDEDYALSIEELIAYLNEKILTDSRFKQFIDADMQKVIENSYTLINSSKDLLVAKNYSRIVLTTNLENEDPDILDFVEDTNKDIKDHDAYLAGDAPMAYEMSKSFDGELNLITILTMVFIFIVVAISFKSILIPFILVLLIECAVFITMDILTFEGSKVYFIAILIVQSILMGATIDYAILFTSYYLEHRKSMDIKEALINSYNKAIHTILTSASILIIVTLIVGNFASAIAAKICITISKGTLCSAILILLILPSLLAAFDKLIVKKRKV